MVSLRLPALLAGLVIGHASAAARSRLRQKFLSRMKGYDTLAECEVAFDKLEERCNRGAHSGGYGRLTHDAAGDGYMDAGGARGRGSYLPPASNSGRPDATSGWDYGQHGEDWSAIGECGLPGQSPVDLAKYVDVRGQTKYVLWFDYYLDPDLKKDHKAKLINDGHGLMYDVQTNQVDLGFVKIGALEYAAAEYVFHAPSEHTIDGAIFPMELQILNRQRDGAGLVAISLLFREGNSSKFIASLMNGLNGEAPTWSTKHGAGIGTISGLFEDAFNLEAVIPKCGPMKEHTFYNYQGTLTQPPCTSGVDWWVLSAPITATRDEIRFIRRAIFASESSRHGNARATTALDGRPIFAGLTGFQHAIKYHKLPSWHGKDALQRPRGYDSQDMPWGDHWEAKVMDASPPVAAPAGGPGAPGAPFAGAPAPAR